MAVLKSLLPRSSGSLPVTLPNGISGPFFIVVETNANGDVDEGAGSSNNLTSTSLMITPAPYADLTVSNVTAQSLVVGGLVDLQRRYIGQAVSWGNGFRNVATWDDRVILSPGNSPTSSDAIVIGDFPHTGLLQPNDPINGVYNQSQIITLPAGTLGHFHLFVETNATGTVFEGPNTAPDVASPPNTVDVSPTPYADLIVNTVMADATGQNNQPINLSWQVTNQGIGTTSTSEWTDEVSYSTDPTGKTGLVNLQRFDHSGARRRWPVGRQQLHAHRPGHAARQPAGGDDLSVRHHRLQRRPLRVHLHQQQHDRLRSSQRLLRAAAAGRPACRRPSEQLASTDRHDHRTRSVDVSWTVTEQRPADATGTWNDTLYLVPSGTSPANVTTQGLNLGSFQHTTAVGAGEYSPHAMVLVTLPIHIQGQYLFYVLVDSKNQVNEAVTNDKLLASAPITIALTPRPNLAVTSTRRAGAGDRRRRDRRQLDRDQPGNGRHAGRQLALGWTPTASHSTHVRQQQPSLLAHAAQRLSLWRTDAVLQLARPRSRCPPPWPATPT